MSLRQLNSKYNGQFRYGRLYFTRSNCFVLSVETDSKDRHGLTRERIAHFFSSFDPMPAIITKKIYG